MFLEAVQTQRWAGRVFQEAGQEERKACEHLDSVRALCQQLEIVGRMQL